MLTGKGQTSCSDHVLPEHWEEARREVAQKHGDNVDPSAGLSHRSSPGRPSPLGVRMTTCLGFRFSGEESVASVSLPSLGQSWKVVGVALEKAGSSSW